MATVLVPTFVMTSCDDMLDTKPQGVFTSEQISDEQALELMTAAYGTLTCHYFGNNEGVFRRIKAFLEDIKYEGVANFDMKYDERDGEYKLFEINLRQGRSSYFVTLNGFNLAKYFVDDLVEDTPFDGNTLFGRGSKLWLEIPKSIFLDYVAEGTDKETGKLMLKSGDWGTTLEYSKDMNPLRWLMIRHMFSIYKKSYAKYFTKKGELK